MQEEQAHQVGDAQYKEAQDLVVCCEYAALGATCGFGLSVVCLLDSFTHFAESVNELAV